MRVKLVMVNTDGDEYPTLPFEFDKSTTGKQKRKAPLEIREFLADALFGTTNVRRLELRDATTNAPIKTIEVSQIDLLLFAQLHSNEG